MTTDARELAEGFDTVSADAWRASVEKGLGDTKFEQALVRRTLDGLARGPLMTRANAPAPAPAPGTAPFIRGSVAERDAHLPWGIRAPIAHPDPVRANTAALGDLAGGASSLELSLDPTGERGVIVRGRDDLERVLNEVDLNLAPVSLDAGDWGPQAAAFLVSLWEARGADKSTLRGAFNFDPYGRLATHTHLPRDLDVELADAATWAFWIADAMPGVTTFRADARVVHEAGGSEAWEIAFATASALAYLKLMVEYDLPLDLAAQQITFAISLDADVHLGIAKLRALRRVWGRIATASGVSAEAARPRVQAFSSNRMLTRRDPWTNLLRLTSAGFAGAIGGAESITLAPFTAALGHATPQAHRLSRNLHVVLQEESHLGRVNDPAGGSFHHEALSNDLALYSWSCFQRIMKAGGLESFIVNGQLSGAVNIIRGARYADITSREAPLVGVSQFAELDGRPVKVETPDLDALVADADARSAARPALDIKPHRLAPDMLIPLAGQDADIGALTGYRSTDRQTEPHHDTPLRPTRLAQAFEALRDDADAFATKTGAPPRVFLATLGALKDFNARATWMRNLLAAGGVEATGGGEYADVDAALAAYGERPARIAVLCASNETYAADGAALARRLKEAGARVWLAGKPGALGVEDEPNLVDHFAHAGANALETLLAAHATLGDT